MYIDRFLWNPKLHKNREMDLNFIAEDNADIFEQFSKRIVYNLIVSEMWIENM